MAENDLAHFLAIPWCASLLNDPQIVLPVQHNNLGPERQPKSFTHGILRTEDGIRAILAFTKGSVGADDSSATFAIPTSYVLVDVGNAVSGWPGVSHGGFTSTLFDYAGGWHIQENVYRAILQNKLPAETRMVTGNLNVNFHKPVLLDRVLLLTSTIAKFEGRKIFVDVKLEDESKETLCTGSLLGILVSPASKL